MVSSDFTVPSPLIGTFGAAAGVEDGLLRLTAADFSQTGSAVLAAPLNLTDTSEFVVDFDMYVGGG